jgi:hypothetical protein
LHYTEVVWRNTGRLGCATVECTNGWWFTTYNYNHWDNYVGQKLWICLYLVRYLSWHYNVMQYKMKLCFIVVFGKLLNNLWMCHLFWHIKYWYIMYFRIGISIWVLQLLGNIVNFSAPNVVYLYALFLIVKMICR